MTLSVGYSLKFMTNYEAFDKIMKIMSLSRHTKKLSLSFIRKDREN